MRICKRDLGQWHIALSCEITIYGRSKHNVSAKMEHAGIAHSTTVGLSVPILPRLLHKHLLLRVTGPGQPCFLICSRTATSPLPVGRPVINAQILAAPGFEHFHSCSTKCNISAKMEHTGIAHSTTIGLSVPILPRLLHKHLLLVVHNPW